MRPGKIHVMQCPLCSALFLRRTYRTLNNYHTIYWSDRIGEEPFNDYRQLFFKCPHCNATFPIKNTVKHSEIDSPNGTLDAEKPEFSDVLKFVLNNELSIEDETEFRLDAWRLGNDKRRDNKSKTAIEIPYDQDEKDNITRLLELMTANEERDRLLRAELLRAVGLFDEAVEIYKANFGTKARPILDEFVKNCTEGNTFIISHKHFEVFPYIALKMTDV